MSRDDIVAEGSGRMGVITQCLSGADGQALVEVEMLQHVSGAAWRRTRLREFWPAASHYSPRLAVAWLERGDGCLIVIEH